jgi:hypothetical protein
MPPVGFKPTISAGERPQTVALDRAATGTGENPHLLHENPLQMSETGVWCSVVKNEFWDYCSLKKQLGYCGKDQNLLIQFIVLLEQNIIYSVVLYRYFIVQIPS